MRKPKMIMGMDGGDNDPDGAACGLNGRGKNPSRSQDRFMAGIRTAPTGGGIGGGRTGDAGKRNMADTTVTAASPPGSQPTRASARGDNPLADAAAFHDDAGIHEQRYGHEVKRIGPAHHPLNHHHQGEIPLGPPWPGSRRRRWPRRWGRWRQTAPPWLPEGERRSFWAFRRGRLGQESQGMDQADGAADRYDAEQKPFGKVQGG